MISFKSPDLGFARILDRKERINRGLLVIVPKLLPANPTTPTSAAFKIEFYFLFFLNKRGCILLR